MTFDLRSTQHCYLLLNIQLCLLILHIFIVLKSKFHFKPEGYNKHQATGMLSSTCVILHTAYNYVSVELTSMMMKTCIHWQDFSWYINQHGIWTTCLLLIDSSLNTRCNRLMIHHHSPIQLIFMLPSGWHFLGCCSNDKVVPSDFFFILLCRTQCEAGNGRRS